MRPTMHHGSWFLLLCVIITNADDCKDGFEAYGDSCLQFFKREENFDQAQRECNEKKGSLPSSLDEDTAKKVFDKVAGSISGNYYIGAVQYPGEQIFRYSDESQEKKESIGYWAEGQPEGNVLDFMCIQLNEDERYYGALAGCGGGAFGICQRANGGCSGDGFDSYQGRCFSVINQEKDYDKHRKNCENINSLMAIVKTKEDRDAAFEAILTVNAVGPNGYLTTAKKDGDQWVDAFGEKIPDDAWLEGGPGDEGDCAVMVPSVKENTMKMRSSSCDVKSGYICNDQEVTTTTTAAPTTTTTTAVPTTTEELRSGLSGTSSSIH